jgi:exonuclease III
MCLNTNGIKNNMNYLNKNAQKYDIIILQETMSIRTDTIKKAFKHNDILNIYNKKAVKTAKRGRGSGGLTFIVNKKFKSQAYFPSDRIGVLMLENLALVSVYFPYHKENDDSQYELYESECSKLIKVVTDLRAKGYKTIVCGDFNVDNYNPDNTNSFQPLYERMVNTLKLNMVDTELPQKIDYTFKTYNTWLDHVLCDNELNECIDVVIKEDYSSKSDHFPLIIRTNYSKRNIPVINTVQKQFDFLPKHILSSPIFKSEFQANINANMLLLKTKINNIHMNITDQEMIDFMTSNFYESLNNSIKKAKEVRISDPKYCHVRSNSWWSDQAQLLHDEKDVLYKIKNKSDSVLARIKRITRQIEGIKNNWTKRGIRGHLTRLNKNFKHERTNFWKQLKRNNTIKVEVDLDTEDIRIEFQKLFNTKLVNTHDNNSLQTKIDQIVNEKLSSGNMNERIIINRLEVLEIINNLASNKANGSTGLNNEIIKLACRLYETDMNIYTSNDIVLDMICFIIQFILDKQVFPNNFNTAEMYALIKCPEKSTSDIGNIRPISVSDILTNIFEKLILNRINLVSAPTMKQFGFTRNASCSHAVFLLKETMNITKIKNKKLYATAIDASKAFDKVNRQLLWLILFKKIGFLLTYILMKYYDISRAYVINKGEKSTVFKTTIGVKQGGPLSPRLFSLYLEDLEEMVDNTGIGIGIGNLHINLLLYADDIILITNNKRQMQQLLNLVENFGRSREIKFNPDKTNFICVNGNLNIKNSLYLNDLEHIKMDGEIIEEVHQIKYLGSYISNNLLNKTHLDERIRLTSAAVNQLAKTSGFENQLVSVKVKAQLYKSYIRPVLTYGLEAMILGTTQLDKIQKKEENIIKKALGLSTRLHSSELMICLGINRMDLKLDSMLPSFFYRLLQNQYTNDFIRQVINNNIKIDKKSIIYHIINKFKTKDMNKLNEKCKLYKGIIDKNFEYEKNELKQFSKLPNLLENMKSNLTEIILSLRAF